jgi:carbon monoxide dehydrogenase subunit G
MYRDAVEQATRDDIAAAAAAHRELGREYDGAVAEGLVDRIGAEIDKRIDARLGSPRSDHSDSRSPVKLRSPGTQAAWIGAGVGAGITGLVAVIANHDNTGTNSGAVITAVIWVWVVLTVAAVGAAVVRKYRRP